MQYSELSWKIIHVIINANEGKTSFEKVNEENFSKKALAKEEKR